MTTTASPAMTPAPTKALSMKTPQEIDRAVRTACFAGVIAGVMILFQTWTTLSRVGASGATFFGLFSGALMFALAYGMTRYNRACAIMMLLFYTTGKLLAVFTQANRLSVFTGLIALVFVFAFVRGIQGTFAHHKLKRRFTNWRQDMDRDLDPALFDE